MMDVIYAFFADPLAHQFMQRALFTSMLIGVVCSVFSCFLLWRMLRFGLLNE